jgi:endonuclease YncB( thermonuclease family)
MHVRLTALALAAAMLACRAAGAAPQDEDGLTPFIEGRVVRVVDGNTLVVEAQTTKAQVRVLLRGMDAPELRQPFGAESRRSLETLIGGASVRVEFKNTDKYGQVYGLVLKDGEDVNLEQLAAGMAWHHLRLANELPAAERKLYEETEREARRARRGLWKDAAPVAPWQFRQANNYSDDPRDDPPAAPARPAAAAVNANRRTRLYFTNECAGFGRVPARQLVRFKSAGAAERAGYRPAPDCAQR